MKMAAALIKKNKALLRARNKQMESPLHKAASYGKSDIFWSLEENGSVCYARRENGATVLHCAVMGNAPSKHSTTISFFLLDSHFIQVPHFNLNISALFWICVEYAR